MKTYAAIGHFKDCTYMTSVAMQCSSVKNFRENLMGNEFVAYAIISEKKLETLKTKDSFELWDEVKKLTTNYRKWNDLCDYFEQCMDMLEERFEAEKERNH